MFGDMASTAADHIVQWSTEFKKPRLYLSRSNKDVMYLPALRGYGFRVRLAFDATEYNAEPGGHTYIDLNVGEWVVPQWKRLGSDTRRVPSDQDWILVRLYSQREVKIGWVPYQYIMYSWRVRMPITYAQLYLGNNLNPIPQLPHLYAAYPAVHNCHATIGYLPLLTDETMDKVMRHGTALIDKYFRDGALPSHSGRPWIGEDDKPRGTCRYHTSALARRGRWGQFNSYPSMIDGEVAQQCHLHRIYAMFSEMKHEVGRSLIGILHDGCRVYDLTLLMRGYLEYEVFGHRGVPECTQLNSLWVQPHITLTPALQRPPERPMNRWFLPPPLPPPPQRPAP